MVGIVNQKNIGALIDVKALSSFLAWTAAGASDNVTWTGITIDRQAFANGSMPLSMDASVVWGAKISASGSSISLAMQVQDSPDGTNWSDFATSASTALYTAGTSGGAAFGTYRMTRSNADNPAVTYNPNSGGLTQSPSIGLSSARRYIRINFVPDMSGAGTDTAVMMAYGVFAGFDLLPAPIG